ncbi:phage tail tube protein [Zoogloea sp.]|uniref:phage tail tube protein n=1 Tax=Zoogloea sp. TaxID=49181 RepID=UPI0026040C00|nr:phage tail tube protein [Zoogloea sp.]
MAQLNNIRSISVPSIGKLPLADKPGTFTPSGTTRTHKAGRLAQDGGYTETSTPAKLDLSINLQGGISIDALNDIKDEDVIVRLADGAVYMLSQAFVTGPIGVGEGDSSLTIMANVSERIG